MSSRDENTDDGRMGAPAQKREDHMMVLNFVEKKYGENEEMEARDAPAGGPRKATVAGKPFVGGRPGRGD